MCNSLSKSSQQQIRAYVVKYFSVTNLKAQSSEKVEVIQGADKHALCLYILSFEI